MDFMISTLQIKQFLGIGTHAKITSHERRKNNDRFYT